MQIVGLKSGLIAHRLDKHEQDILWNELDKPTFNSNTPFFTPNDNLQYFVIDRSQTGYICTDTIKANGKTFKVIADVCKLDAATLKAVRKAYKL